ncbi:MAG: hypothetical protein HC916_17540 [Coleofasciculaceae cyanobacterium SM2_1_6]|nr:hypothetical protein [Coleofasciculaceae cyanobacterium SM2_1_6]
MIGKKIHSIDDLIDNRYKILSFAGEGGMQEVYCALDQVLDKKVALKVPNTISRNS